MAELGDSLSANELAEWELFWELEPWGDDWRRTGEIAATLANTAQSQRIFKPDDFLPRGAKRPQADDPDREQTPEEQIAILKSLG